MPERFEAELRPTGRTATYIDIPFDAKARFGSGRSRVRGTINDQPFRSTLAKRGAGWYMVVNRETRAGARASAGETVTVEMERDDEPRVVEMPDDLREALLARPGAAGRFDSLSYSHQKEYVDWVNEAKRAETRKRRIAKTVELVSAGARLR